MNGTRNPNDSGLKGQPVVQILGKSHDRSQFNSGNGRLDKYIKERADQDVKNGLSCVYVLVTTSDPQTVLGFYTLSNDSFALDTLPKELTKNFPRNRKVPAILLGQFALDQSIQRQGLGLMFLASAIRIATKLSERSASYALIVHALDEGVEKFYKRAGFIRLKTKGLHLFLPLKKP